MNSSDREALNNALSDQKTIDQLSSSGIAAKMKREENKAMLAAQEKAEAEAKAKEQAKIEEGSGGKAGS
jgi:hypothetical protein